MKKKLWVLNLTCEGEKEYLKDAAHVMEIVCKERNVEVTEINLHKHWDYDLNPEVKEEKKEETGGDKG